MVIVIKNNAMLFATNVQSFQVQVTRFLNIAGQQRGTSFSLPQSQSLR